MAARLAAVAGAKIVSVCDLQASSTLAATQHVSIGPPMRALAPALAAHCRASRSHTDVTIGRYIWSISREQKRGLASPCSFPQHRVFRPCTSP